MLISWSIIIDTISLAMRAFKKLSDTYLCITYFVLVFLQCFKYNIELINHMDGSWVWIILCITHNFQIIVMFLYKTWHFVNRSIKPTIQLYAYKDKIWPYSLHNPHRKHGFSYLIFNTYNIHFYNFCNSFSASHLQDKQSKHIKPQTCTSSQRFMAYNWTLTQASRIQTTSSSF